MKFLLLLAVTLTSVNGLDILGHIRGAIRSTGQTFGHVGAITTGISVAAFDELNKNVFSQIDSGLKVSFDAINNNVFQNVAKGGDIAIHGISDAGNTAIHGITDVGNTAVKGIVDTGNTAVKGIVDTGNTAVEGIKFAANKVGEGVVTGAHAIDDNVIKNIDKFVIQNIAMAGNEAVKAVDREVVGNIAMAGNVVIQGVITGTTASIDGITHAALSVKSAFEQLPDNLNTFGNMVKDAGIAFVRSDPIVFLVDCVNEFVAGIVEGYTGDIPEEEQEKLTDAQKEADKVWRDLDDHIKMFYIYNLCQKSFVALLSSLSQEMVKYTLNLLDTFKKMSSSEQISYLTEGAKMYREKYGS